MSMSTNKWLNHELFDCNFEIGSRRLGFYYVLRQNVTELGDLENREQDTCITCITQTLAVFREPTPRFTQTYLDIESGVVDIDMYCANRNTYNNLSCLLSRTTRLHRFSQSVFVLTYHGKNVMSILRMTSNVRTECYV